MVEKTQVHSESHIDRTTLKYNNNSNNNNNNKLLNVSDRK